MTRIGKLEAEKKILILVKMKTFEEKMQRIWNFSLPGPLQKRKREKKSASDSNEESKE